MYGCLSSSTPTTLVELCGPEDVDALLSIARQYPNCIVVADEIYDGLDFTGQHVSVASRSQDVPVIALNGVSKVYYAPGWRIGYMALHDPTQRLGEVRDGLERLLRSRLCASTPAQLVTLRAWNRTGVGWMVMLARVKGTTRSLPSTNPSNRWTGSGTTLGHSTCLSVSPMRCGQTMTSLRSQITPRGTCPPRPWEWILSGTRKGPCSFGLLGRHGGLDEAFNRMERFLLKHRSSNMS